ncbi:MAG: hypothetical protein KF753_02395 [Caldilineaceae bacterium]|nr:hypothetical protein [Caldilineaceae bacterium]
MLRYIAAYLLWFLFCGLSFWAIWLVRTNLVDDIFFGRVDPWQLRAIDRGSVWLMGGAWVVGIFLSEGYLRKGVEKGRFLLYSRRLFAIPLIVIALSYLIHAL